MSGTDHQTARDANHRYLFAENAGAVAARVESVRYLEQAMDHCVGLCLPESSHTAAREPGRTLTDGAKRIAAPNLGPQAAEIFGAACREKKIDLLRGHLRTHLQARTDRFEVGFTIADYGVADTGTLILDSALEDIRLATMFCNIHVAVLPASRIVGRMADIASEVSRMMAASGGYVAFITGASRTADIERVLAIGVHGPRQLHILIMEAF